MGLWPPVLQSSNPRVQSKRGMHVWLASIFAVALLGVLPPAASATKQQMFGILFPELPGYDAPRRRRPGQPDCGGDSRGARSHVRPEPRYRRQSRQAAIVLHLLRPVRRSRHDAGHAASSGQLRRPHHAAQRPRPASESRQRLWPEATVRSPTLRGGRKAPQGQRPRPPTQPRRVGHSHRGPQRRKPGHRPDPRGLPARPQ